MKILIVEDDAILAMLAAELLEDEGFQVVGPAHSVEDALVLVASNKPDLALVDINLAGYNEGVGLAPGGGDPRSAHPALRAEARHHAHPEGDDPPA